MKKKLMVALAAVAILAGGLAGPAQAATAATCKGVNKHEWVMYPDPNTGASMEDTYLDSCKVKSLRDKYGQAKDAAGLAALLGSRWWPVGVTAGVMYAWAWNNQTQLNGCSKNNTGVRIRQWNGLVIGCYAQ
ncbi:hypothetical protein [Microbacterium aurum]